MNQITFTLHDDFGLILIPYAISAESVKNFIMNNLDSLMKNNLIWDIRGTEKIPLDSDYIWGMLDMLKLFPNQEKHKKNAIVASVDEQLQSLRTMIKMLKDHEFTPNIQCFEHIDFAIKWIRE